jgi:ferric-dicitrate binding protein FerR (iron transport regulator)
MRRETVARDERAWRGRIVAALAVAATVVVGAGGAWRVVRAPHPVAAASPPAARVASASGAVLLSHQGITKALGALGDATIAPEDDVATSDDAKARLVLDSGATVELVAATQVHLRAGRPKNERIKLLAGEIAVHVPKLGTDESFRVETPDAEVAVHGTSFVVTVDHARTHVRVTEGIVSVRQGESTTFVHPGEAWPAPAPPVASPDSAPPVVSTPPPSTSSPAPLPAGSHGSAKRAAVDASTLAEQNSILQRALDERRHGDDAHAIQDIDLLLARYPKSPLAQEARVERFRALERMGQHARAVADARRYLADFSGGFATDEAKALILR